MELRYLHLAKDKCVCSPKESLYNINHCTKEKVFVVEGPMDAIRMGDDCVSVQGLQVTEAQVTELKNRFKEIYIAFDNEKPAQVQAEKLAVKLVSLGAKVSVVDILSDFNKKDPGDLMPREVKQIKKHFRFL
jgi:DNA primase